MQKDLKLSTQIYAFENPAHSINKCSEHCTVQLHQLMKEYEYFMEEHGLNYKDTHSERMEYRTVVTKNYWSIVKEYWLSQLYYREDEIKNCENFVRRMERSFEQWKE